MEKRRKKRPAGSTAHSIVATQARRLPANEYFVGITTTFAARIELKFVEETPIEAFQAIVDGLPNGWQIYFFDKDYDKDYPQEDREPGVYVELERVGRRYRYRRSISHYCDFWQQTTPEAAADYLYRCRNLYSPPDLRPRLQHKQRKWWTSGP